MRVGNGLKWLRTVSSYDAALRAVTLTGLYLRVQHW
jgi:hypothetical protein